MCTFGHARNDHPCERTPPDDRAEGGRKGDQDDTAVHSDVSADRLTASSTNCTCNASANDGAGSAPVGPPPAPGPGQHPHPGHAQPQQGVARLGQDEHGGHEAGGEEERKT